MAESSLGSLRRALVVCHPLVPLYRRLPLYLLISAVLLMEGMYLTFLLPFAGRLVLHWQGLDSVPTHNASSSMNVTSATSSSGSNGYTTFDGSGSLNSDSDPAASAGLYTGLLVSSLQFGNAFASRFWGRMSDTVGRTPPLVLGTTSSAVCVLLFGTAPSLWAAVPLRLLHGVLSGTSPLIKSVVAECGTDEATKVTLWAAVSASWAVGAMLGPTVGGFLYQVTLPVVGVSFNPGFTACAVMAVGALLTSIPAALAIPETNPKVLRAAEEAAEDRSVITAAQSPPPGDPEPDAPSAVTVGESSDGDRAGGHESRTEAKGTDAVTGSTSFTLRDLYLNSRHWALRRCVLAYLSCCAINILYVEIVPLFAIIPRGLHATRRTLGLGLTVQQVGLCFTVFAVASLVFNIFVFKPVVAQFGRLAVTRWSFLAWAATVAALPFATAPFDATSSTGAVIAVICALGACRSFVYSAAFSLTSLMIGDLAPKAHIGEITGLAHMSGNIVRAVLPLAATPLFSWTVSNRGVVLATTSFVAMGAVCVLGWWLMVPLSMAVFEASKGAAEAASRTEDAMEEEVEVAPLDGSDEEMEDRPLVR